MAVTVHRAPPYQAALGAREVQVAAEGAALLLQAAQVEAGVVRQVRLRGKAGRLMRGRPGEGGSRGNGAIFSSHGWAAAQLLPPPAAAKPQTFCLLFPSHRGTLLAATTTTASLSPNWVTLRLNDSTPSKPPSSAWSLVASNTTTAALAPR